LNLWDWSVLDRDLQLALENNRLHRVSLTMV
jgi:hypothetical protein